MRSIWIIPTSIALSLSVVQPSTALTINFSGDLTGQPTFDSPDIVGTGMPITTVGLPDFPYSSQPFYVGTTGTYDFLSTSGAFTTDALTTNNPPWNNVTILYVNNFDPNNPLTNAVIANNDFPTQGFSGFNSINLTANTQYYFVTTVFNPDDGYGIFNNSITGTGTNPITLGTVPAVPFEFSQSLGLLILGGYGAFAWLRKHKKLSLFASKSEYRN